MNNWGKLFADLQSGALIETAMLFEMASFFAVTGEYEKKRIIYDAIFDHPSATEEDKARVLVYRQDLIRRLGKPEGALEGLKKIEPNGKIVKMEYYQALGQCHLKMGNLPEAIKVQREILGLLDESCAADKRLYYLETMLAMKLDVGEIDLELDQFFEQYIMTLFEIPEGSIKQRARGMYHDLRGELAVRKGKTYEAICEFVLYFLATPAARNRSVAVIKCLAECGKVHEKPDKMILDWWLKHGTGDLQPTDFVEMQERIDLISK